MWILLVRWDIILWEGAFWVVKEIAMPGYLVFCGLMLWYLIATFWVGNERYKEEVNKERIATRSFLIGSVCGIVFAVIYILTIA